MLRKFGIVLLAIMLVGGLLISCGDKAEISPYGVIFDLAEWIASDDSGNSGRLGSVWLENGTYEIGEFGMKVSRSIHWGGPQFVLTGMGGLGLDVTNLEYMFTASGTGIPGHTISIEDPDPQWQKYAEAVVGKDGTWSIEWLIEDTFPNVNGTGSGKVRFQSPPGSFGDFVIESFTIECLQDPEPPVPPTYEIEKPEFGGEVATLEGWMGVFDFATGSSNFIKGSGGEGTTFAVEDAWVDFRFRTGLAVRDRTAANDGIIIDINDFTEWMEEEYTIDDYEFLFEIEGYLLASTTPIFSLTPIGAGTGSVTATANPAGFFSLSATLGGASSDFTLNTSTQLRLATGDTSDFIVTSLVVTAVDMPIEPDSRPIGPIFTLAEWMNGRTTWGDNEANSPLRQAGGPTITITSGTLVITDQTAGWNGIDLMFEDLELVLEKNKYTLNVKGYLVGDVDNERVILGGPDDPWPWFANTSLTGENPTFDLTVTINSAADSMFLSQPAIRIGDGTTEDIVITHITVTHDGVITP